MHNEVEEMYTLYLTVVIINLAISTLRVTEEKLDQQNYKAQIGLAEKSTVNDPYVEVTFHLSGSGKSRRLHFHRPDMLKHWRAYIEVFEDGKRVPFIELKDTDWIGPTRQIELFPGDRFSFTIRLRDIYLLSGSWRQLEVKFTEIAVKTENYQEYNTLILRRP